jgi:cytochrome c oxidase assembly factor CtaG
VTVGTGSERSLHPSEPEPGGTGRSALLLTALVLLVASLVPPVATEARRYEVAEAIQFCLLLVAIPALVVLGAPWRRLGLAGSEVRAPDDGGATAAAPAPRLPVDRLARGRHRHPEVWRSAGFFGLYLAGAVLWRTPPAVNGLARHPWLVVVEVVTLVAVGTGLWLELAESPPLAPRLSRPHRVALAAGSMWLVWVLAYLVGLSHVSWYHAYPHHPGSGLSLSADQQLTTGMMWFISGCAFIPVVFWNLVRWLQSEEDPDEELHHLLRQERIRGRTVEGGPVTG